MQSKVHFLEETIRCLERNGKTEEDVLWVGRGFRKFKSPNMPEKYKTTWEDFRSKADFWYDSGYGLRYIPDDLIVAGKDFWLERAEEDGREWWKFHAMPAEPVLARELDLSVS